MRTFWTVYPDDPDIAPVYQDHMYAYSDLAYLESEMGNTELADKYRMPSMLLADGTMGQMMEPVLLPEESNVTVEKPWALTGTKMPEELEKTNFDRFEKYKLIEENEVMYEEYMMEDAEVCVVAFGIAARVSKNAVVEARKQGIKAGLLRPITLWPFPTKAVKQAAEHCKGFVSVELSMGQMIEDIKLASDCARPVELCNRAGGMIPSPEQVLASIKNIAGGNE